jgi:Tol biopolymer transport system component
MQIDANDGSQRPLSNQKWTSESGPDLEWLPDGGGLLLTIERENEGMRQIYALSISNAQLTPITNDFNDYTGLSLSTDSKYILTSQRSFNSNIWVAPSHHLEKGRYITSGSLTQDGAIGLSWSPDNKIIFSSKEPTGGNQLYVVNADGKDRKKITTGKDNKYWPVISRDGRYIAYNTRENENFKIWRMDNDGSNLKVLSGRNKVRWPRLSPDSQWIIFSTFGNEKQELVRLSMKDEKETVLTSHRYIYGASISPDGKQIAYVCLEHEFDEDLILNIISSEGGPATKNIHLEKDAYTANRMHWTPDGTGIAYLHFEKGVSNIHIQPVDGSPPRPLTNFKDENITNFSWSLDGKQIAYSRGKDNYDVVLIENVP